MSPSSSHGHRLKAFVPFTSAMADISFYLDRAAFVQTFGRSIKVEDVATTLAHKAKVPGSWRNIKNLPKEQEFFMACPSYEVVQHLSALRHIRGDGFLLLVNHWGQSKGSAPHSRKYKVCISLINLPLVCGSPKAIAKIVAGFGVPLHASKSSTRWEDLTSFDLSIYCENMAAILDSVDVTFGPYTHNVKVVINYFSPHEPNFLDSSSSSSR